MAFVLPTFNVSANVYDGNGPGIFVPGTQRLVVLCNFSLGRLVITGPDAQPSNLPGTGSGIDSVYRIMRVPALTDIRSAWSLATFPDEVEVPAGSGCFYIVEDVADQAKGFPNEHRLAWVIVDRRNPIPFPMP